MRRHRHDESPRAVLLIHGAGSGPWIFDGWSDAFSAETLHPVDLQEVVEIERASMSHYANAIVHAARRHPRPLATVAWSMGGLAAMMAAKALKAMCLVLLEPSPPAEIQGWYPMSSKLDPGTFDPEDEYGSFPSGVRSRPESTLARAERKAGISVPALPCPSLVVSGTEFAVERGSRVAALYRSQELSFRGFNHWQLVRDRRVRQAIAEHLGGSPKVG